MLDLATARELFEYDHAAGALRWRVSKGAAKKGNVAGTRRPDGRMAVFVDYRPHYVANVVWLLVKGEWPPSQLDHRDRDPSNNRVDNLRPSTHAQNQWNVRCRGFYRKGNGYAARIRIGAGRRLWLGSFDTEDEAREAYNRAVLKHHGAYGCLSQ